MPKSAPIRLTITIFLIDRHALVRAGVEKLIETEGGALEVIGESGCAREALDQIVALQPDVVLLDIELAGVNGMESLRRLHDRHFKVLILSASATPHILDESFRAGAAGYVLKDCGFTELVSAIRTVHSGDVYICDALRNQVLECSLKHGGYSVPAEERITKREGEVLTLAAQGCSSTTIAEKLGMSRRTAEAHRAHLMKKLSLHTQTDLVLYGVRAGIIAL
jgi:two-component system response regulator NreC